MFRLTKFLSLFACTILAAHLSWCQDDIIINGKVVYETGRPVKNASVKIDIHNARTNSNGNFIIKNGNFPAQITVKGNLYNDYTDILLFPDKWKDTMTVYVVMSGKETQLDEVTINADSKFWI